MSVHSSSPDHSDVQVIPMDRWREEGKVTGGPYRSGYQVSTNDKGTFLVYFLTKSFGCQSFSITKATEMDQLFDE